MSDNVIVSQDGNLLGKELLEGIFGRDRLACVNFLRHELIQAFPQLREKIKWASRLTPPCSIYNHK